MRRFKPLNPPRRPGPWASLTRLGDRPHRAGSPVIITGANTEAPGATPTAEACLSFLRPNLTESVGRQGRAHGGTGVGAARRASGRSL